MSEVRLTSPLSWLDGVDPETGIIIQQGHPQKGLSISGKIVRMPYSIGSTAGAYVLLAMARRGTAPARIVLERPDSVTICAELAGIPVEVIGSGEPPKLTADAPEELIRFLEKEAASAGADGYVRVSSSHISGISYATIGNEGMEFLEELAERGLRIRVRRATTNPAGMDLERWREMGVPEWFAEKQMRIVRALSSIGAELTLTCTPYLIGNRPSAGQHICWGEFSAVAFANSVLGARTNREGGIKSLVAAIVGWTPAYGMHLDEGRKLSLIHI